MKSFLLSILVFPLAVWGQPNLIEKDTVDGVEYNLYPSLQRFQYENSIDHWRIRIINDAYKLPNNVSIDGNWIQYYDTDSQKIAKTFHLKNSKLNGPYRFYHPNGLIEKTGYYEDDRSIGMQLTWSEDGVLIDSTSYVSDTSKFNGHISAKRLGVCKVWYENGNLKQVASYFPPGIRSGIWREYYDTGELKTLAKYTGNKIDSVYEEYARNGNILFTQNYQKGRMIDTFSAYNYPNGIIQKRGEIRNGVPNGNWEFFHSNGVKCCIGNYLEYSTLYCYSAAPRNCNFSVKTGNWEYYYSNGQLKAKGEYLPVNEWTSRGETKQPVEIGVWEYYYPNGRLMAVGEYELSPVSTKNRQKRKRREDDRVKRVGTWKYYERNGELLLDRAEWKNVIDSIDEINIEIKEMTKFR